MRPGNHSRTLINTDYKQGPTTEGYVFCMELQPPQLATIKPLFDNRMTKSLERTICVFISLGFCRKMWDYGEWIFVEVVLWLNTGGGG